MTKAIFFDIDGTLINIHHKKTSISLPVKKAIRELRAAGHHTFIASGRPFAYLSDELTQEGIHIIRCLGHGLLKRICGIVGTVHKSCLLSSETGYLNHDGEGIELSCAISAMDGGLEDTFAQLSIVKTGKDSLLGGVDYDDTIGSF